MIDVLLNLDLTQHPVTNMPDFDPQTAEEILAPLCFGRIPHAMASGASAVAIIAQTKSGHIKIVTSMKLFRAAADVFAAQDKEEELKRLRGGN